MSKRVAPCVTPSDNRCSGQRFVLPLNRNLGPLAAAPGGHILWSGLGSWVPIVLLFAGRASGPCACPARDRRSQVLARAACAELRAHGKARQALKTILDHEHEIRTAWRKHFGR